MSTELLTTTVYAKKKKKDRTTVFRAAKDNKLELLPGVIKVVKAGRYLLLEVAI